MQVLRASTATLVYRNGQGATDTSVQFSAFLPPKSTFVQRLRGSAAAHARIPALRVPWWQRRPWRVAPVLLRQPLQPMPCVLVPIEWRNCTHRLRLAAARAAAAFPAAVRLRSCPGVAAVCSMAAAAAASIVQRHSRTLVLPPPLLLLLLQRLLLLLQVERIRMHLRVVLLLLLLHHLLRRLHMLQLCRRPCCSGAIPGQQDRLS